MMKKIKDQRRPTVKKSNKPKYWIVLLFVLGIWGINWALIGFSELQRGTIGDMFGVVNSLFSGLAFAYLIISVRIQSQELEQNKKELDKQKDSLKRQEENSRLQRFENTLFELMTTNRQIIDDIEFITKDEIVHGRACFKLFFNELMRVMRIEQVNPPPVDEYDKIDMSYDLFYRKHGDSLGHYFRNLYHIVKFIAESEIDNRKRYTSLIRSQFSEYQYILIFYNCLSAYGRDKFKPLIEQFQLLENMNANHIIDKNHIKLYAPEAY